MNFSCFNRNILEHNIDSGIQSVLMISLIKYASMLNRRCFIQANLNYWKTLLTIILFTCHDEQYNEHSQGKCAKLVDFDDIPDRLISLNVIITSNWMCYCQKSIILSIKFQQNKLHNLYMIWPILPKFMEDNIIIF